MLNGLIRQNRRQILKRTIKPGYLLSRVLRTEMDTIQNGQTIPAKASKANQAKGVVAMTVNRIVNRPPLCMFIFSLPLCVPAQCLAISALP